MAVGVAHALEETPHQAAIHRDGRPVYITGALRCQKCDYGGKLLGRSDEACGNVASPAGEDLFRLDVRTRGNTFRESIEACRARIPWANVIYSNTGAYSFASVRLNPVAAARTDLDSSSPSTGCFTADEKNPLLAAATIGMRLCSPRSILPVLSKPSMLSRNAAPRPVKYRRIGESRPASPASNSVHKSE